MRLLIFAVLAVAALVAPAIANALNPVAPQPLDETGAARVNVTAAPRLQVEIVEQAQENIFFHADWASNGCPPPTGKSYVVPSGKTLFITDFISADARNPTQFIFPGGWLNVPAYQGLGAHLALSTPLRFAQGATIQIASGVCSGSGAGAFSGYLLNN